MTVRFFHQVFVFAAVTLVACVAAAQLQSLHWRFGLFVNFLTQYWIAALILALCCLSVRKGRWAIGMAVLAVLVFWQSRSMMEAPWAFSAPDRAGRPTLRIVQYNQWAGNVAPQTFQRWLLNRADELDVVVIQEMNEAALAMAERMTAAYPYRFGHKPKDAVGTLILSRHPFETAIDHPLYGPLYVNHLLRVDVRPPGFDRPVTLYTLHATQPISSPGMAQRAVEFSRVKQILTQDAAPHRLLVGDLNTTPFADAFADLLDGLDLRYQSYGLLQAPTWPTFSPVDLLRIRIDHMLYDPGLELVAQSRRTDFPSDHAALIGVFSPR